MLTFRSQHGHSSKYIAIKRLGIISIFIALAYASFETVWPFLLKNIFLESSTIGFVTAGLSIIWLLSFLFLVPIFEKIAAKKLFFMSISINSILLILFAFTNNYWLFFIIAISNVIFSAIRIQSFGILLRDNSSMKTISKNETLMYLLGNIGWLLGPLIAGFVAQQFTYNLVFIYAAALLLLSTHIYAFTRLTEHKQENEKVNIFRNIKNFFENKELTKAYLLNGGLEVWWILIYIFVPLKIISAGFGGKYVGVFLFSITIPLLIVEQVMRKRVIEFSKRKILILGYIIVSICGFAAFFISNLLLLCIILTIASFGMGFIEPTVESLFFALTRQSEERKYYGPFITAKVVGAFIGKLGVATILLFLPLKWGILYIVIMMVILIKVAHSLKKLY